MGWTHGTIGIVGTGHISTALAIQYAKHDIPVLLGSRTPSKAADLARRVGGSARPASSIDELIAQSSAIWIPLPAAPRPDAPDGVIDFLSEYGKQLSGKILLEVPGPSSDSAAHAFRCIHA